MPLSLGSDQHAVIDPFEEVRGVEMHERLESLERGRFASGDLLGMASLQRLPLARLGRRRRSRPGTSPTWSPCASTARARPVPARGVLYAATSADVTDVVVAGEQVVRDGRHRSGDVGRLLADAIAAVRR